MLHDMVRGGYNIAKGADEVAVPGTSLHSSFVSAMMYYWLVLVNGTLSHQQGQTLITVFLVRAKPSHGCHIGCSCMRYRVRPPACTSMTRHSMRKSLVLNVATACMPPYH